MSAFLTALTFYCLDSWLLQRSQVQMDFRSSSARRVAVCIQCHAHPGRYIPVNLEQRPGCYNVCVRVCVCAQSCLTLCDATDCSLQGSSVHGSFQARILEWVAILPLGDFLNPVKEPESPASPALACRFFTIEPPDYVPRHFMYVLYYAKSYLPGP